MRSKRQVNTIKLVYIEIHRKDDDCLREPMQFNFLLAWCQWFVASCPQWDLSEDSSLHYLPISFQMKSAHKPMDNAEQGFLCLACEETHTEPDVPSLEKHFAAKHGVLNLLASPATQVGRWFETYSHPWSRCSQAVMPPRKIRSGCHASSCNPCEPLYGCLFCGGPGLQEKMMKEHLKRVHGNFFQNSWKDFCVSHCR